MSAASSNSLFVLKLIGSLFSINTVLMTGAVVLLLTNNGINETGNEFKGLVVSAGILAFSTAVIAFFVWWIISNRKRFMQQES